MNTNKNKSSFEFNDPKLIASILLINPSYSENLSLIKSLNFNIETIGSKPEDMDNETRHSSVMLTVKTSNEIKMDDKTPCFILVSMQAEFKWKKGVYTEKQEKSLIKVNAPSLLLSYIRPHLAELTEASEIPVQHIPFIDFTKIINEKGKG